MKGSLFCQSYDLLSNPNEYMSDSENKERKLKVVKINLINVLLSF